jgi:hypothetical protein
MIDAKIQQVNAGQFNYTRPDGAICMGQMSVFLFGTRERGKFYRIMADREGVTVFMFLVRDRGMPDKSSVSPFGGKQHLVAWSRFAGNDATPWRAQTQLWQRLHMLTTSKGEIIPHPVQQGATS